MSQRPIYYLPISDPDVLLEGCETLLRLLIQRIIERFINGYSNYTDEARVVRVIVLKIEIDFSS